MNTAAIITLVATYGPQILPLIQQITAWAEGGKTALTAAEIQQLIDFGKKSSADYLKEAGIAIVDGKVVPAPTA